MEYLKILNGLVSPIGNTKKNIMIDKSLPGVNEVSPIRGERGNLDF